VDAVVCDPPYGIDFQHEPWDGQAIRESAAQRTGRTLRPGEAFQAWATEWAGECARVSKPGGHLLAFGSPRTFHRLAAGLEDAGWQIRDTLIWLYGTGMPKSRRLPDGQGSALKPAWEPILLARKPPGGTLSASLAEHGTGALNVDGCRVNGRYPANALLTHHPDCTATSCTGECPAALIDNMGRRASRLFYCPKASRSERDAGCEQLPARPLDLFPQAARFAPPPAARNPHPTVKPLALMRWLVRLATPRGGLVLDPFCGSGSTGAAAMLEQRRFLGIERDRDYTRIARARIAHWGRTNPAEGEASIDRPFELSARPGR
jgi:DNA modification methylase